MSKQHGRWAAVALGCAVLGGIGGYGVTSRAAPAAAVEEMRHPRIHHAVQALREAEAELSEAPHNFGGHKVKALDAIHAAVEHLQAAEKY